MKTLKFMSLMLIALVGVSSVQADRKNNSKDNAVCGHQEFFRVGILATNDAPPFTGWDEESFGFDVSIWLAFAESLGIAIEFIGVPSFESLFNALRNNQIDATGNSIAGLSAARRAEFDAIAISAKQTTTQAFVFNSTSIPAGFPTDDPQAALDFILAHANPSDPEFVKVGAFSPSFQFDSLVAQGYPTSSLIGITSGGNTEIAAGFCNGNWDVFFNDPSILEGVQQEITCDISLGVLDGIPLDPSQFTSGSGYFFRKNECSQLLSTLQTCLNQIIANGQYQQFVNETINDVRFNESDRNTFKQNLVIPLINSNNKNSIIAPKNVAKTSPAIPQKASDTAAASLGFSPDAPKSSLVKLAVSDNVEKKALLPKKTVENKAAATPALIKAVPALKAIAAQSAGVNKLAPMQQVIQRANIGSPVKVAVGENREKKASDELAKKTFLPKGATKKLVAVTPAIKAVPTLKTNAPEVGFDKLALIKHLTQKATIESPVKMAIVENVEKKATNVRAKKTLLPKSVQNKSAPKKLVATAPETKKAVPALKASSAQPAVLNKLALVQQVTTGFEVKAAPAGKKTLMVKKAIENKSAPKKLVATAPETKKAVPALKASSAQPAVLNKLAPVQQVATGFEVKAAVSEKTPDLLAKKTLLVKKAIENKSAPKKLVATAPETKKAVPALKASSAQPAVLNKLAPVQQVATGFEVKAAPAGKKTLMVKKAIENKSAPKKLVTTAPETKKAVPALKASSAQPAVLNKLAPVQQVATGFEVKAAPAGKKTLLEKKAIENKSAPKKLVATAPETKKAVPALKASSAQPAVLNKLAPVQQVATGFEVKAAPAGKKTLLVKKAIENKSAPKKLVATAPETKKAVPALKASSAQPAVLNKLAPVQQVATGFEVKAAASEKKAAPAGKKTIARPPQKMAGPETIKQRPAQVENTKHTKRNK